MQQQQQPNGQTLDKDKQWGKRRSSRKKGSMVKNKRIHAAKMQYHLRECA